MQQNGTVDLVSVDALKSWLVDWLAGELAMDPREINPEQTFLSYGLDSVQAMSMVGELESKLGRRLSPTLAWDYPTITTIAEHLAGPLGAGAVGTAGHGRSQPAPDAARAQIESLLAGIDNLEDQEVDRLLAQYLGEAS